MSVNPLGLPSHGPGDLGRQQGCWGLGRGGFGSGQGGASPGRRWDELSPGLVGIRAGPVSPPCHACPSSLHFLPSCLVFPCAPPPRSCSFLSAHVSPVWGGSRLSHMSTRVFSVGLHVRCTLHRGVGCVRVNVHVCAPCV